MTQELKDLTYVKPLFSTSHVLKDGKKPKYFDSTTISATPINDIINYLEGKQMTEQELEEKLKLYIERIELLHEEKIGAVTQIKELYEEAEEQDGLDPKAIKEIIKLRKLDRDQYANQQRTESTLDRYKSILRM